MIDAALDFPLADDALGHPEELIRIAQGIDADIDERAAQAHGIDEAGIVRDGNAVLGRHLFDGTDLGEPLPNGARGRIEPCPHRLAEIQPPLFGKRERLLGLARIDGEGLLAQDGNARIEAQPDIVEVLICRYGDVGGTNALCLQRVLRRRIRLCAVLLRKLLCAFGRTIPAGDDLLSLLLYKFVRDLSRDVAAAQKCPTKHTLSPSAAAFTGAAAHFFDYL